MASNSIYAQYPVLKKIGNDSVIIITLRQGEQINKSFDKDRIKISQLNDSIKILNERTSILKEMSLRRLIYEDSLKLSADTTAVKYRVATELYDDSKKEYRKYLRNTSIYAATLTLFIMILAGASDK